MSNALPGRGCKLQRSTDGGTNYSDVPEVTSIKLPIQISEYEATNHGSAGWREFKQGLKDLSIPVEMNYVPTDTIHAGILADALASTERYYKVLTPAGATIVTLKAGINSPDIDLPVDGLLKFNFTLHNADIPVFG